MSNEENLPAETELTPDPPPLASAEAVAARTNLCANCGSELSGHFCAICGQPNTEVKRPLLYLLRDLLNVVLDLDGRAYRSLFLLFTRPAYLSRSYVEGQRYRYTPPLRLFLAISILFFVVLTVENSLQALNSSLQEIQSEPAAEEVLVTEEAADAGSNLADQNPGLTEGENFLEGIYGLIENINLPLLSAQSNENLHAVMRVQARENYEALMDDPAETLSGLLEYITVFMLAMMPLLALIQQIFFFPARRYYIEHLVLTLHNNAFMILVFLMQTLLGVIVDLDIVALSSAAGWLSNLLMLWLPVYLYLSLKFFFGWGWFLTGFLYLLVSICYAISMGVGMAMLGLTLFLLF